MVYRIKANYEIIRHYRCTLLLYFDWLMEWSTWLWLANGVWHKMCDWLTELQMAVIAWVAFATKNLLTDCSAQASARIIWWGGIILRVACRGLPHTFTVLRSKHEQHRYSQLFYLGRKRENIKYKQKTTWEKQNYWSYCKLMLFWDVEQIQLWLDKYFLIKFICEWQPIGREVGGQNCIYGEYDTLL